MGDSLDPVDLGNNTVQDVAAGQSHTCVVLTTGDVACWGYNYYGEVKSNRRRWSVKVGGTTSHPFSFLTTRVRACFVEHVGACKGNGSHRKI